MTTTLGKVMLLKACCCAEEQVVTSRVATYWAPTLVGVVLASALVAGCARPPTKAIVSGTVRYKGSPVAEGVVWLSDPVRGRVDSAPLRSGTFVFDKPIDVGDRIGMITPELDGAEPPKAQEYKDVADIPKKYRAEFTSGLKFTLVPGKNELTIELE